MIEVCLYLDKGDGLTDPDVQRRYGHLFQHYRADAWYWNVQESIRKLLLTSVIVFFGRGSNLQLLVGLFVSVLAHLLHLYFAPFKLAFLNAVQNLSLSATWFTLLMGLGLRLQAFPQNSITLVSVITLLVNFCVPILAVVFAFVSLKKKVFDMDGDFDVSQRQIVASNHVRGVAMAAAIEMELPKKLDNEGEFDARQSYAPPPVEDVPLPLDWTLEYDEHDNEYYFNSATGESRWERPI